MFAGCRKILRFLRLFSRSEDGQVTFLMAWVMFLFLGLIGIVMNGGEAVQAKIETQNLADKAAYTSAVTLARGYNLISNCNIALLELTAMMAVLDSFGPTYDEAMLILTIEEWAANAGSFFGSFIPFVGPAISAGCRVAAMEIKIEKKLLKLFKKGGDLVNTPFVRKTVKAGIVIIENIAQGIAYGWQAFVIANGVSAGKSEHTICVPYFPKLKMPVKSDRLVVYREKGMKILGENPIRKLAAYFLIPAIASQARTLWLDNTKSRFDDLIRRSRPKCIVFQRDPSKMGPRYIQKYFRMTMYVKREALTRRLPGFLGERSDQDMFAMAESLVYNPDSWDLVTPCWEAALVPVTRGKWMAHVLSGVFPAYDIHH